jgi:hypothetical protein
MTRELVVDGFAVVGVLACLYWATRGLLAFLGWVARSEIERQTREAEADRALLPAGSRSSAAPSPGDDVPADHLAAIAGAVAALGDFHIVLIQEASGHTWANEGRWLHQTSHRLR